MQVAINSVGHRFPGGPWLFKGLSILLEPGEVYALVGPSGSGKSTLLSLIAGWVDPAEGTIERRGEGRTAWVFQNPHGSPHRTVLDHVVFPLLTAGATREKAEAEALRFLETFGLDALADHLFHSLSGGEAQRLMLTRAVASRPALFLIDEPTAQLDLHTRKDVNDAIAALADPSTIVVIATHDEATRDMCTQVLDLRAYQDEPTRPEPQLGWDNGMSVAPAAPTRSGTEGSRGLR